MLRMRLLLRSRSCGRQHVTGVLLPLLLLLLLQLQLTHRPAQGLRLRLQRLPQLAQLPGVLALHLRRRVVRCCEARGEQPELLLERRLHARRAGSQQTLHV